MKLYGFYRPEYIGTLNLGQQSLNGKYTLSFYLNGQYADYIQAGVISIKDMEVPTERYTKEVAPGIKDLREFVVYEYDTNYVDLELMNKIISKIGNRFDLEVLTIEQAREFIRTHTDLQEVETGKFLISEASEFNGEVIEAKYLIIN